MVRSNRLSRLESTPNQLTANQRRHTKPQRTGLVPRGELSLDDNSVKPTQRTINQRKDTLSEQSRRDAARSPIKKGSTADLVGRSGGGCWSFVESV